MSKGNNPNRSPADQLIHDRIVKIIADDFYSRGYFVCADISGWPHGTPNVVNGYTPDITASGHNKFIIVEVETCPTYNDVHTKAQLAAFSKSTTTYIFIQPECRKNNQYHNLVADVKAILRLWDLKSVRIGTCDPDSGELHYDV